MELGNSHSRKLASSTLALLLVISRWAPFTDLVGLTHMPTLKLVRARELVSARVRVSSPSKVTASRIWPLSPASGQAVAGAQVAA